MGGVDRHDQLRLQAYSMQLSTRFNKYYKSLFLGLVDMALVNAYIVYRRLWEKKKRKSSHFIFLAKLQEDLIKQSEDSFTQTTAVQNTALVRPNDMGGDHKLVQTKDYRLNNNIQRLRQRQCKVCSCYGPADKKRGGTSTYFCASCSHGKRGVVTLCNKVRGHPKNEGLTCSQICAHCVTKRGVCTERKPFA
ncbi:hypothetical protein PHMEG_0004115 [Phytophthora megakarya]|uniref:PiggyBac transposable element-derived protein domain-containing protein n=1 Tax=Phytophthora megakarya TaxID=4795 RepID=A0A225WUP8_9STRA|nr:hypothetical protein PHMEG_0004115 [Phytophthora megakarya]